MSRYTFWAQRGHTGNIRHTKHTMGTPEMMYIAQLTLGTGHTGHTGRVPRQSGSCPSVSRYTALQLESIKATCSTVDRQKQTHIYAKTHKHTLYYAHQGPAQQQKNANKYAYYIHLYGRLPNLYSILLTNFIRPFGL